MKPVDPLQLQRLTDGELSIDQIKLVIEDAEANPDQWPTIAKALIEDKLWQRQLLPSTRPKTESDSLALATSDRRQNQFSWSQWLSVAAALMVATVGGYLAAGAGTNVAPSAINAPQLANSTMANSNLADPNPASAVSPASFTPDFHLKFSDNENLARQGFSPNGQVPLYSINNADQLRQFQKRQAFEPVSRQLMEKLTAAGYRVNNKIELISGDFNGQQKFVVPVRTICLEPSQ